MARTKQADIRTFPVFTKRLSNGKYYWRREECNVQERDYNDGRGKKTYLEILPGLHTMSRVEEMEEYDDLYIFPHYPREWPLIGRGK